MIPAADMTRGPMLRLYLLMSHALPLIAPFVLRNRLRRGKEHPTKWPQKLGKSLSERPSGLLIWLHAVGLGEVLSTRSLITRLGGRFPDAHFLVTSSTATSETVFAKNMPERTFHQFLPLDAPSYRKRFLDHFRPDLCLWIEQDIWPGMASDLAARGIPQGFIAARMNAQSFANRDKVRGIYKDIYSAMQLITAQDEGAATFLRQLGAPQVQVAGSLKPGAPLLTVDDDALQVLKAQLTDRKIWAVAPSHPADESFAMAAQAQIRQTCPEALLIIAPRHPARMKELPGKRRSKGEIPTSADDVWLFDTFGELGLVYSLARMALIGGTFDQTEGHNPWEAAMFGCAVAHGPNVAHFQTDFAVLDAAQGAKLTANQDALTRFFASEELGNAGAAAKAVAALQAQQTDHVVDQIVALLGVNPSG